MSQQTAVPRPEPLDRLLRAAEAALEASAPPRSPERAAVDRVFGRVRARTGHIDMAAPKTLPVVAHLPAALDATGGGARVAVAEALREIAPSLGWARRSSASAEDATFWNGHANAMILGPGAIEERDDLWIGVTLMAPHVSYAEHSHPPEEVYLRLAPGEWWNARMDWTDPGETSLIYNPPGIQHAMRSGDTPFLALWFLPL